MPFIGKQSTSNSQITSYTTTVGSGGQTNFTVVIEGGDETHVYLNGVLLKETTDYTVSSTQVSLVSPAVENDIVEIKVFRSFALVDAVKATGGTFTGNVETTGIIKTDDIQEKTTDHGVEIEQVTLKDGSGTFTGNVGIGGSPDELLHLKSATSLQPVLKIENTNDDNLNPQINLVKNTANAANNDYVGQVDFDGTNSSGTLKTYGRIQAQAKDVVNGQEDGRVFIASLKNGTLDETVNVESGNVGIGTSTLTGGNVKLDLANTGSGVGTQIRLKNQHNAGFYVGQAGDTSGDVIVWNDANTNMQFRTNGDKRMNILADGRIVNFEYLRTCSTTEGVAGMQQWVYTATISGTHFELGRVSMEYDNVSYIMFIHNQYGSWNSLCIQGTHGYGGYTYDSVAATKRVEVGSNTNGVLMNSETYRPAIFLTRMSGYTSGDMTVQVLMICFSRMTTQNVASGGDDIWDNTNMTRIQ